MIDDLVVGEGVAVLVGGVAEPAEEILSLGGGPQRGDPGAEVLDELTTALEPPVIGRAGPVLADRCDGGGDGIHERLVQGVGLVPERRPDERLGGDVERQRLDRAVEVHGAELAPLGDPAFDHRVHEVHVADEGVLAERRLHDPPVEPVVVPVPEHEPSPKEDADGRLPTQLGREDLVPIQEDGPGGIGCGEDDPRVAEDLDLEHPPVTRSQFEHEPLGVADEGKRVTDPREAEVPGDVRERVRSHGGQVSR